jgi:hypothetical protein
MNDESAQPSRWEPVLKQMFDELLSGAPRAEVYWAQQLAFGPVFFYAVVLAVRSGNIGPDDFERLRKLVPMALALLGALPDGGERKTRLLLLARRQALALAQGRRRLLAKLAARLGLEISSPPYDPVPERLQRPYELIGWSPPEQE